jgi:hypothetical protein
MSWIASDPSSYYGQVVGEGECVACVQRACGAPIPLSGGGVSSSKATPFREVRR